jgi:hypothetical protein
MIVEAPLNCLGMQIKLLILRVLALFIISLMRSARNDVDRHDIKSRKTSADPSD